MINGILGYKIYEMDHPYHPWSLTHVYLYQSNMWILEVLCSNRIKELNLCFFLFVEIKGQKGIRKHTPS